MQLKDVVLEALERVPAAPARGQAFRALHAVQEARVPQRVRALEEEAEEAEAEEEEEEEEEEEDRVFTRIPLFPTRVFSKRSMSCRVIPLSASFPMSFLL